MDADDYISYSYFLNYHHFLQFKHSMSQNYKKSSILHELEQAIKKKVIEKSKTKENQRSNFHCSQDKRKSQGRPSHEQSTAKQAYPSSNQKLQKPISLFYNENLKNVQNRDPTKSGLNNPKKSNAKRVQKLLSLVSYTLKSAQKLVKYINLSNFEAEFAVKLFTSDKQNLLNQIKKISIQEAMLESQRSDSRYENCLNCQTFQQQNSKLRKEIKFLGQKKQGSGMKVSGSYSVSLEKFELSEKLVKKFEECIERLNGKKIRERLCPILQKQNQYEDILLKGKYKQNSPPLANRVYSKEQIEQYLHELREQKTLLFDQSSMGAYQQAQWRQIKQYIQSNLSDSGFKPEDNHYKVLLKKISSFSLSSSLKQSQMKKQRRAEHEYQKIKLIKQEKEQLTLQIQKMKESLSNMHNLSKIQNCNDELNQLINAMKSKLKQIILMVYEDDEESRKELEGKFVEIKGFSLKQELTYLYQMVKYSLKDYKELQVEFQSFVKKAQQADQEAQSLKEHYTQQEKELLQKISCLTHTNSILNNQASKSSTSTQTKQTKTLQNEEIRLLEEEITYKQKQCKRLEEEYKNVINELSEVNQKMEKLQKQFEGVKKDSKEQIERIREELYKECSKNNDIALESSSWRNRCVELEREKQEFHKKFDETYRDLTGKNEKMCEQIVSMQNELKTSEENNLKLSKKLQALKDQLNNKQDLNTKDLTENIRQLEYHIETLKNELKRKQSDLVELQTDRQALQTTANQYFEQISTLQEQNSQINQHLQSQQQTLKEINEINKSVTQEVDKLRDQIRKLSNECEQQQKVLETQQEQHEEEISNKIAKLKELSKVVEQREEQLKDKSIQVNELRAENEEIRQRIEDLMKQISQMKYKYEEQCNKSESLELRVLEKEQMIEHRDKKILQLEAEIEKLDYKMITLSKQREEIDHKSSQILKQKNQNLQKQLQKAHSSTQQLQEQIQKLFTELQEQKSSVSALSLKNQQLQSSKIQLKEQKQLLLEKIQRKQSQLLEVHQEILKNKQLCSELSDTLEQKEEEVSNLSSKCQQLEKKLQKTKAQSQKQIQQLLVQNQELHSEIAIHSNTTQQLEESLQQIKEQAESYYIELQQNRRLKEQYLQDLQEQRQQFFETTHELQNKINTFYSEISQKSSIISQLKSDKDELAKQKQQILRELENIQQGKIQTIDYTPELESLQVKILNLSREVEVNLLKEKQYCNLIKRILRATIDLDELVEKDEEINDLGIECLLERGARKTMEYRRKQRQQESEEKKNKRNSHCLHCTCFSHEEITPIELTFHQETESHNYNSINRKEDHELFSIKLEENQENKFDIFSHREKSEVQPFILNTKKSQFEFSKEERKKASNNLVCLSDRCMNTESLSQQLLDKLEKSACQQQIKNEEKFEVKYWTHKENVQIQQQNEDKEKAQDKGEEKTEQRAQNGEEQKKSEQQFKEQNGSENLSCNFDEFDDMKSQIQGQPLCSIDGPQEDNFKLQQSLRVENAEPIDLESKPVQKQQILQKFQVIPQASEKQLHQQTENNVDQFDFGDFDNNNHALQSSMISKQDQQEQELDNIDDFNNFELESGALDNSMISHQQNNENPTNQINQIDDFSEFNQNSLNSSMISQTQPKKQDQLVDFDQFNQNNSEMDSSIISESQTQIKM